MERKEIEIAKNQDLIDYVAENQADLKECAIRIYTDEAMFDRLKALGEVSVSKIGIKGGERNTITITCPETGNLTEVKLNRVDEAQHLLISVKAADIDYECPPIDKTRRFIRVINDQTEVEA